MKILLPPVYERVTDQLNPFDSDDFGRKLLADNLTSIFKNTTDGLVVSINANWGDGKTSFVKLWEMELQRDEQLIPIYYDAFRNDFTSDPFLSIAVLIHKHLEQVLSDQEGLTGPKNKDQLNALKGQTKKLALELVKMGTGLAASHLTAGIVNSDKISNWTGDAVQKLLFATLEDKIDAKFQAHLEVIDSVKIYQDQLKAILACQEAVSQKKIVFFVDELDRCRPDFALQVIESIKHLFDIENVFFVLTVNQVLLKKTIESVYGVGQEDASVYFQKFIHLETELPPLPVRKVEHVDMELPNLKNYLEDLSKFHEIYSFFTDNHIHFNSLEKLIAHHQIRLNPRSIERSFSLITIGLGSTFPITQINKDYLKAMCLMSILKVAKPELYKASQNGKFQKSQKVFSDQLWEFLKKYLDSTDLNQIATNVFESPAVFQVCRILDMFSIPAVEEKIDLKQNKSSEGTN